MVNKYKKPKSRSALCLLVLCGCAIMFFALVLIGASFAINYDEDFDLDDGDLEAYIKVRFNYDQYWAGVPVCSLQFRWWRAIAPKKCRDFQYSQSKKMAWKLFDVKISMLLLNDYLKLFTEKIVSVLYWCTKL